MWETSPRLTHPPDLWCREMSASSQTETIRVMNHQVSQQKQSVSKINIFARLSERIIRAALPFYNKNLIHSQHLSADMR